MFILSATRSEPFKLLGESTRREADNSRWVSSLERPIDVWNWKTGKDVASDDFTLAIPQDAKEVKPDDIPDFDELPAIFAVKGAQ